MTAVRVLAAWFAISFVAGPLIGRFLFGRWGRP